MNYEEKLKEIEGEITRLQYTLRDFKDRVKAIEQRIAYLQGQYDLISKLKEENSNEDNSD